MLTPFYGRIRFLPSTLFHFGMVVFICSLYSLCIPFTTVSFKKSYFKLVSIIYIIYILCIYSMGPHQHFALRNQLNIRLILIIQIPWCVWKRLTGIFIAANTMNLLMWNEPMLFEYMALPTKENQNSSMFNSLFVNLYGELLLPPHYNDTSLTS